MCELTHSEQAVLTAIVCHIEAHGYAPSTRELCEMTGIKSTSTLHTTKMALKEKGIIECASGKNRAIKVKDGPTTDVVEVVRCKDCVYANDDGTICRYGVGRDTRPMGYCDRGESKGGANNDL